MNKDIWIDVYAELPCPTCLKGALVYDKHGLLTETLQSLKDNEYHKQGSVYPTTTYLASTHLKCNKCNDVVIMTYKKIEDVRYEDEEGNEITIIDPISYYPAPKIISIPDSCPDSVKNLMDQSYALFWIDLNSCGNKIRIAVEALMDSFGIPAETKDRKPIMLHNRIQTFRKKNPSVSKYLLSIKWIGNLGSHISGLSKEAVLDAYELMEYSLEKLYNDREKEIELLSDSINKARRHIGTKTNQIVPDISIAGGKVEKHLQSYVSKQQNDNAVQLPMTVYFQTTLSGSVSFDYSNNNGNYTIGKDAYTFDTKWSTASNTIIHIYNDNISGVALAKGVTNMSDIKNPSLYDFSSRTRAPAVGNIVVLKNEFGNYALVQITKILCSLHGDTKDQLDFDYLILNKQ